MMRNSMTSRLATLLLALSLWPVSQAFAADLVTIENAWARATVPGQTVGAAYLELTSAESATVVKVESPAADFVEIHSMTMKQGVMEMRMLDKLPLPAGETVKLEPGGFHLMLIDLKAPLKAGEHVPLVLHVSGRDGKSRRVEVQALVKGR